MGNIKGSAGCQPLANSFIAAGEVEMATGGGIQVITNGKILAGDKAFVTLQSDDSGTPITSLKAVCTANTLTITRNDDASAEPDANLRI